MIRRGLLNIKQARHVYEKGERDTTIDRLINEIEEWQLNMILPKNFDTKDPENHINDLEKSFENVCTSMEELGIHGVHELSTFQFYSKIRYFKKKQAAQAAAHASKR